MSSEPDYFAPEGMRVYAIGDIHGHVDLLEKMHEAISMDLLRQPPERTHIVYMGDYIDRGPDSRGVIDSLIARRDRGDGVPKTFLKGNHENALFEFHRDPVGDKWLDWGGLETLASYGITFDTDILEGILPAEKERAAEEMKGAIPLEHLAFMDELELSIEIGDYFFAHAGVDPTLPFDAQSEHDLTLMRQPFLSWHENPLYAPLSKKVVHGHTPSKEPENLPHRIGIDTHVYDSGVLSAAVLEGTDVRFLKVE